MEEAKKIGLACKSGNVTDCNEGLPVNEKVPEHCQGVLIFSETANYPHTCGKYCNDSKADSNETIADSNADSNGTIADSNARRARKLSDECQTIKKCGWTKFMRFVNISNQVKFLLIVLILQKVLETMRIISKRQKKHIKLMILKTSNLNILIARKKLLWFVKNLDICLGIA